MTYIVRKIPKNNQSIWSIRFPSVSTNSTLGTSVNKKHFPQLLTELEDSKDGITN
jgi:hypothetical protein